MNTTPEEERPENPHGGCMGCLCLLLAALCTKVSVRAAACFDLSDIILVCISVICLVCCIIIVHLITIYLKKHER